MSSSGIERNLLSRRHYYDRNSSSSILYYVKCLDTLFDTYGYPYKYKGAIVSFPRMVLAKIKDG